MDIQLKKGLLEFCVLSALKKEESYGYKIINDLRNVVPLSESTLYTILKRLESEKCLTTFTKEESGRLRKYYRITQAGKDKVQEFIDGQEEFITIMQYITRREE